MIVAGTKADNSIDINVISSAIDGGQKQSYLEECSNLLFDQTSDSPCKVHSCFGWVRSSVRWGGIII